jgi:hypothetical protein
MLKKKEEKEEEKESSSTSSSSSSTRKALCFHNRNQDVLDFTVQSLVLSGSLQLSFKFL